MPVRVILLLLEMIYDIAINYTADHEEIFNALKVIHEVGLFHWFNADTGIYDKLTGDETTEEMYKIAGIAIETVLKGEKIPLKIKILLRYAKSDSS
jgi:hypothetical protein